MNEKELLCVFWKMTYKDISVGVYLAFCSFLISCHLLELGVFKVLVQTLAYMCFSVCLISVLLQCG